MTMCFPFSLSFFFFFLEDHYDRRGSRGTGCKSLFLHRGVTTLGRSTGRVTRSSESWCWKGSLLCEIGVNRQSSSSTVEGPTGNR